MVEMRTLEWKSVSVAGGDNFRKLCLRVWGRAGAEVFRAAKARMGNCMRTCSSFNEISVMRELAQDS